MPAAILDKPLLIEQGATWDFALVWKTKARTPVSLEGCQARMQFRKTFGSQVILDLSSTDGSLIIDVATGGIQAQVSAEETATITSRSGVFDLEVYHPDGRVDRILQGEWILSPEVTK